MNSLIELDENDYQPLKTLKELPSSFSKRHFVDNLIDPKEFMYAAPQKLKPSGRITPSRINTYKMSYLMENTPVEHPGDPENTIPRQLYRMAIDYAAVIIELPLHWSERPEGSDSDKIPLKPKLKRLNQTGAFRIVSPRMYLPNGEIVTRKKYDFYDPFEAEDPFIYSVRYVFVYGNFPRAIPIVVFTSYVFKSSSGRHEAHLNGFFLNRQVSPQRLEWFEPNKEPINKKFADLSRVIINRMTASKFKKVVRIPSTVDMRGQVCSIHDRVLGQVENDKSYGFKYESKRHSKIDPGGYCAPISINVMKYRLRYPRMKLKDVVKFFEKKIRDIDFGPHMTVPYYDEGERDSKDKDRGLNTFFRTYAQNILTNERYSFSTDSDLEKKYGDRRKKKTSKRSRSLLKKGQKK